MPKAVLPLSFVNLYVYLVSSLPSVVKSFFKPPFHLWEISFEYGFLNYFRVPWLLTVFNLPQMTRNVEDSFEHVHHTQFRPVWDFSVRWKNETMLSFLKSYLVLLLVYCIRLLRGCSLIYTAGQSK